MREAAFIASLTIRGTVFGVDLSAPLFRLPALETAPAAPSGVSLPNPSRHPSPVAPAASAEVAELQRRLLASGDQDVAALMSNESDQLDPLNVASLARWLQAKGHDMDVAEEHIHVHAHWRQSFMPAGHIPEDQIVNELASNKVYLQGNDIQGRTVFVVLAKQQEMGRADETKRFICYTLDNAIAAADPARNELRQFVCLFDLAGLRMKNLDVGALQAVFEVLQQHYPERLGELWFLNAPFIFWGLWRVVSPFIQQATKEKIKFLSGKERDRMRQYIPQDVLPQAYGGAAPMIPIENAVHARLVREGLERARSSPDSDAAEDAPDAEGRLTRAGRAVQRWGRAMADFARRHNPGNGVHRIRGWRPFHRDPAVLYVDEATSTKGEEGEDSSMLSQVEGSVGHLVMYLMPQVFIVAIFRKAQQALWWAWSHARKMKGLHHPDCDALEGHSLSVDQPASSHSCSPNSMQEAWLSSSQAGLESHPLPACWDQDSLKTSSCTRQSRQAQQLSVSAQQDASTDAARLRHSVQGGDVVQNAGLDSGLCSFSICDNDLDDGLAAEPYLPALDRREVCRLQRLWRHHLQLALRD
ncbi:hypothetical protein ABBQ32_003820 [Trebouxia sp. C0010 RCD-2024]